MTSMKIQLCHNIYIHIMINWLGDKMENIMVKIIENVEIAKNTFQMRFDWKAKDEIKAGQFINLKVDNYFLRRPISISFVGENFVEIIYKVVGDGTATLSRLEKGDYVDLIGALGNGYKILDKDKVLLLGGGAGVPPMLELAKRYKNNGSEVSVVIGFSSVDDVFAESRFKELGCNIYVTTDDGSYGYKGNIIECVENLNLDTSFVCACGPMGLLRAIESRYKEGFVSFESRMACGMGACMACVAQDKVEEALYHRICKEGPVFPIGRLNY